MNKINVAVFFGGESLENEVSKITGAQIINALSKSKYRVLPIFIDENFTWWHIKKYPKQSIENKKNKTKVSICLGENYFNFKNCLKTKIKIHCAVLATHGGKGENGVLAGILESCKIPHTASPTTSSALTMDKHLTKLVMKENSMHFLPYEILTKKDFLSLRKENFEELNIRLNENKWNETNPNNPLLKANNCKNNSKQQKIKKNSNSTINKSTTLAKIENFIAEQKFPLVVKPTNQGSSIAVSFVKNLSQLKNALELAFCYSNAVIIEKGIKNVQEFNCSAMRVENQIKVSEIEKPLHNHTILTYADKYGAKLGSKLKYSQNSKLGKGKLEGDFEVSKVSSATASKGMCSLSRELPAKISNELKAEIENLTRLAYKVFNCAGIVRCDFIYFNKKVYLNEINSIPGSLANYLWTTKSYTFSTLLDEQIREAIKTFNQKK